MINHDKLLNAPRWSMAKCNKYNLQQCEKCVDKQNCYTYLTLSEVLK